jgi:Amt family ammonium transporter
VKQQYQFRSLWVFLPVLLALLFGTSVHAQDKTAEPAPAVSAPATSPAPAPSAPAPAPAPKLDKGDNAWMLTSSALVLMMTIPGLFLFYGGLVRSKNILGTIMHSFIMVGVVTVQWVLWGYSVAFGPDVGGLFGSLAWVGLNGVGTEPNADYAATIPHMTFMDHHRVRSPSPLGLGRQRLDARNGRVGFRGRHGCSY